MQLRNLPDLNGIDVIANHSFVFEAHNSDKSVLITRYRGTALRSGSEETALVSWQKSIYHFGGLTREVPIFITLKLQPDGIIKEIEIDEHSNGSQGKRCSFPCLESCISSKLCGKSIDDVSTCFPSAVETKCLHIFEILSAASSFYAYLKQQRLRNGEEQELFTIDPTTDGLISNNKHEVLGRTSETELVFTHDSMPVLNANNLPEKLNLSALIRYNSAAAKREAIRAESFEASYAQLNRLTSKCYHLEKKFFDFSGRIRFTNFPAMVGLFILAMSHEGLNGRATRAIEIEKILHYLQTGYGDHPCKGFGG